MKMRYFGIVIGVLLIAVGVWQLATLLVESETQKKEEQNIRQLMQTEQSPKPETENMLAKFWALYEENSDIVGWLSIGGTRIDYPVLQCTDDSYYLHRNFYKEEDRYGCLYVKQSADIFTPATNFVIYGHNMKDGAMFGTLKKYCDEAYFRAYPTISFDTLYEERTYEIVSVFQSQVYDANEKGVFRYYQFRQADTQEEFDDFYDNIKKLSLYDTEVEAVCGDTFLTLSTCDYHLKNGRFVVVAKRVS